MSESDSAQQKARARMQAEQRLIVLATMQAKRSGKIPARQDTTGAEIVTALFVIVAVVGMLALVLHYGH